MMNFFENLDMDDFLRDIKVWLATPTFNPTWPVRNYHLLFLGFYLLMRYCISKSKSFDPNVKKVTASHILVETKEKALEIKEELKQFAGDQKALGYNFAKQAFDHSKCPSGRNNLGSLSTFGPGQMVLEFDEVVWTLPLDTVSDPVKTQFGYHLILVEDREIPEEKVAATADAAKTKKEN